MLPDSRVIKHAGPPLGDQSAQTQEAMMTTTVATPLRGSSPHRIRRNLIAALAGGVLIASTALVVNRIVDDDSATVPVRASEAPSIQAATPSPEARIAATPPQGRFVIDDAMSTSCGNGFVDACHFTATWVPAPALSSSATAMDVCGGEFGWVCAVAGLSGGVTAADVCVGGLGWACVFTPQS